MFFAESAADPLVISLLTGRPNPICCRSSRPTVRSIINRSAQRLTDVFLGSWVGASADDAGVLARSIVRLAMSYVSMPPEADHDVAGRPCSFADTVRRAMTGSPNRATSAR